MDRTLIPRAAPLLMAGALVLLGGASAPSSPDKVGDTSYLEGTVSVQRDGQDLDSSEVQTGLAIENYDMVKTAADGLAEVSITTPKSAGATIKVSPRTQFTFELNNTGSRQQSFVGLMSGTVALKVAKLTGSQDLMVHTESAVMGVRGTEFSVTAPPTGDILVTCKSGDVVITDEKGNEFHATPGTAVVKRFGEPLGTLVVTGDVDAFRKSWEDERLAFLKEHAIDVMQREARRYDALADEFDAEYAALQEKKEILAKWRAEEKKGIVGSQDEVEKEKGEIWDLLGRPSRNPVPAGEGALPAGHAEGPARPGNRGRGHPQGADDKGVLRTFRKGSGRPGASPGGRSLRDEALCATEQGPGSDGGRRPAPVLRAAARAPQGAARAQEDDTWEIS